MASARAKLRCFLARVRSATRASMSASEKASVASEGGVGLVEAAVLFGPGDGGAGVLGVVIGDDGEDGVEEIEDSEDLDGVAALEGAVVGGGVGGADEVEDGGAGFGRVEVVGEGGGVELGGAGGEGFDVRVDALGEGASPSAPLSMRA